MSDIVITSNTAPDVASMQKKYIWAKPTDGGFKYFTYFNGEWMPLAYGDGSSGVCGCTPLSLEEIQEILK